jgi:hypothetical protein
MIRSAKSYSIVDHKLLHGKYLHNLSHSAMALYLFLVVVGDQEGKSFYGEKTLVSILRMTPAQLHSAIGELVQAGLIVHQTPYFWVQTIQGGFCERRTDSKSGLSKGSLETQFPADRRQEAWALPEESLKTLFRNLRETIYADKMHG